MRAPGFGAPPADLYAAAIDMCAWAETRGAAASPPTLPGPISNAPRPPPPRRTIQRGRESEFHDAVAACRVAGFTLGRRTGEEQSYEGCRVVHRRRRQGRDRRRPPTPGSGTRWGMGTFGGQGRSRRRRAGRRRPARRDGHRRRRRPDRPGTGLRGVCGQRARARRGGGARLRAAAEGRHQRRVDVVDQPGAPPVVFRPGLARRARGGGHRRRRLVLRVGHLSRLRLRSARAAHDDAVEAHPDHHGQRGRAQRPLPGGPT